MRSGARAQSACGEGERQCRVPGYGDPVPESEAEVRAASGRDAAGVAAVYRPYVVGSAASFEQDPPEEDEVRRRMFASPQLPWLVAERDGVLVGYAYASRHRERPAYRWSVEVSVYLVPPEAGRGTGRRLYEGLLRAVHDLGYVSVFAGITLPNDASVGLHEAMGFVPVGIFRRVGFKHGRWHDVGWWQRTLAQPPSTPGDPLAWSETAPETRRPARGSAAPDRRS
jgi:L-amino acid N-acyltransferase YncA